jgi:hypothetical protein
MGNANPQTRREFTRRGDRIEELVSRIETSGDLAKRAVAQELLQAVIELHGVALERILDAVAALPQADTVLDSIAADEIVSGVLALHNIHPVALETRVRSALESARPYLNSHGGDRVGLHRGWNRPCSLAWHMRKLFLIDETLKQTVESAIYSAAPKVSTVIAEPLPVQPQPVLVTLQVS